MIVVDRVSKLYGARWALSDVSFEIGAGEVVGFLGLNGAGKTTMLKILCGILWPSAGRVSVGGADCLEEPRAVRRRCGFLPDSPPLYGEMTVRAMLDHTARLNGMERRAVMARVEAVVELCQLTEVVDDPVAWLSHGYRKRVGIAQAIVHEPALVVLDEPTGGLDPEQIVAMRGLIRRLAERHTVLISSHILSEIERTCDRLLVLHQGRIVAHGREDELRGRVAGRLRVALRGDAGVALRVAQGLAGVRDVAAVPAPGSLVELSATVASAEAGERLVASLAGADFGIRRVEPATGEGLESVFLQLTRGAPRATE